MTADVVCIGDNVVDVYVDEGLMYPGGNAVNVAVHVRRLGVPAAYIGALGDDVAGGVLLRALESEGVDVTRTRIVSGTNAHAEVRLVDGDRVFTHGSIGVSQFAPDQQDLAMLAEAGIVHTGECSMVEDYLPELAAAARLLSFDFSERPWEYVAQHAPHAGLAILSRPTGTEDDLGDLARHVLALGPTQVVVSTGAGGAMWSDGSREVHAAAPPAEVVDTLGAGDALIARILVALATGESPDVFMPAATAYATATCMERGAFGHAAPLSTTSRNDPQRKA